MNRSAARNKRATYPAYRPSGVAWLGDVPEHWAIRRLKYTADLINVKVDGADNNLPYTGLEHIESWTGKRVSPNGDATSEGQANLYHRGDVLFGKLRPYLAKAHAADSDGICTGELLVLRPKVVQQKFLVDYVLNPDFVAIVDSSTYGAKMPRANWDFIGNLPALVPPLPEQRAIAAFLDRETARIDGLIEKKRRQIELLQEKRSALISHAVTKGLDPNAKMKDSGIEWLGEIPEHWEVLKLKYIASVQFSNVDKNSVEGEETVRLCNYVDVYNNDFITGDLPFMSATATKGEIRKFRVRRGDVIITKDSESWTDIAVPSYVSDEIKDVLCGYHLAQIRANTRLIDCKYLFRAFSSKPINHQFQVASTGITRYGLGNYSLENGLLVLPTLLEQRAIAAYLDRETARIDALIEKVEKSIELLREYRAALISAAVTGKIDVRKEGAA